MEYNTRESPIFSQQGADNQRRAMTTAAFPLPRRPTYPTGVWGLADHGRP